MADVDWSEVRFSLNLLPEVRSLVQRDGPGCRLDLVDRSSGTPLGFLLLQTNTHASPASRQSHKSSTSIRVSSNSDVSDGIVFDLSGQVQSATLQSIPSDDHAASQIWVSTDNAPTSSIASPKSASEEASSDRLDPSNAEPVCTDGMELPSSVAESDATHASSSNNMRVKKISKKKMQAIRRVLGLHQECSSGAGSKFQSVVKGRRKYHQCPECRKLFLGSVKNAETHFNSVHLRLKYSCGVCGAQRTTAGNLRTHLLHAHPQQ